MSCELCQSENHTFPVSREELRECRDNLAAKVTEYRGAIDNLNIMAQDGFTKTMHDRWRDVEVEPLPDDDDMIRVWAECVEFGDPPQELVLNSLGPSERDDWTITHWRPLPKAPEAAP